MVNCVEIPENSLLDNILLVSVLISRYIRATRWTKIFMKYIVQSTLYCVTFSGQGSGS